MVIVILTLAISKKKSKRINTPSMSFNSDANTTNLADSLPEQPGDYNFEPKIFWSVNAFIFVLICISAVFCCFGQRYFSHEGNRLNQSDQNILRQLRRRQEADRTEVEDKNLEGRKRKLLAGFAKHKVEMVRMICAISIYFYSVRRADKNNCYF
jgi:magnesium-transporting ATPase (P-type)